MLSKLKVLRRWQSEPLYLDNGPRRRWIADILEEYGAKEDDLIFELGCNAGMNLRELSARGFTNLDGVDMSAGAVQYAAEHVSGMAGAVSDLASYFKDVDSYDEFSSADFVFSMAVLMHIHPEDRGFFKKIHNVVNKYLICAEWTKGSNNYIMPIDPKDFEGFDLIRNEPIEGLPDLVGYSLYVFKKKET